MAGLDSPEPGGLPAFAAEMNLAIADLGTMAHEAETAIASGEAGAVVAFPDGIVCERDPETGAVVLHECIAPPADFSE